MNRLFFPLRSNGSWFFDALAREQLERRVKLSLLLYDTLIFEDARYQINVWENGHTEVYMSPDAIPGDRADISFCTRGEEASFGVSTTPDGVFHKIIEGPMIEAYEVDYYPILLAAGLLDAEFIQMQSLLVNEDAKRAIKERAASDRRNKELTDAIEGTDFQKTVLIEGIHYDSAVAFHLDAPFSVDPKIASFIQRKNALLADSTLSPQFNIQVLKSIQKFAFPDFSELHWQEIVKIRESEAGHDLRSVVQKLARRLTEALVEVDDAVEISNLSRGLFIEELVGEVRRLSPSVSDVMFSLFTNLIPFAGWVASAAEGVNTLRHNQSWISLLE